MHDCTPGSTARTTESQVRAAPESTDPAGPTAAARALMRTALPNALGTLQRDLAQMGGYSFGWCEPDGTPTNALAGKLVRPTLVLLSAEAVGARAADVVPGMVAVELTHLFSLVHDDIMDGDETRRHRPTVWKAYGTGAAVLAGDALFALAIELLAEVGGRNGAAAVRSLSRAVTDLINGQAQDVGFESRPWTGPGAVTVAEYRAMTADKTAALLGCAAGMGALLAAAPEGSVTALTRYGQSLGLAFQAVDDLLGLRGDPDRTGKAVHADLARRKKTLPVIAALATDAPAARALAAHLDGTSAETGAGSPREPARAAHLVEEAGGIRLTEEFARHHHERALEALRSASLAPTAVEALAALSHRLLGRED